MIVIKLDELIKKKMPNISNRQLAKDIGISHVALHFMRTGKSYNPSLEMLDRLCNFFKCDVADILAHRPAGRPRKVEVMSKHGGRVETR